MRQRRPTINYIKYDYGYGEKGRTYVSECVGCHALVETSNIDVHEAVCIAAQIRRRSPDMPEPEPIDVDAIRAEYTHGLRITLIKPMKDDPNPIALGSVGTVQHVDDAGTIHVLWDDGRYLGLIPGIDHFQAEVKS